MKTIKTGSLQQVVKALLVAFLAVFFLVGCDAIKDELNQDIEEAAEGEGYTVADFFQEAQYPNDALSEAMTSYQSLLEEYPMDSFFFDDGTVEPGNTLTQILNNFNPGSPAEHTQVNESEEYLFYEFTSDQPLNDQENSDETASAYIGLYFVRGYLIEAGIFTNQTEFEDASFLAADKVSQVTEEGADLSKLGGEKPTLAAFAQMNFEGSDHYLLAFPGQTSSGGQVVQLSLYDQDLTLKKSDILGTQFLDPASINNTMINQLLNYYTVDILGLDESEAQQSQTGGSYMSQEDFQAKKDSLLEKAKSATEDKPMTVDQAQEIMGEPMNQGASAFDYQSQTEDGNIDILTVVYNEKEEVTNLSLRKQGSSLAFPFDEAEIQKLGQMDASTSIEEIEELYVPAHVIEYNLSTGETLYMWLSDDQEAAVNILQIIVNREGQIDGIAYDGAQSSEGEEG